MHIKAREEDEEGSKEKRRSSSPSCELCMCSAGREEARVCPTVIKQARSQLSNEGGCQSALRLTWIAELGKRERIRELVHWPGKS